MPPAGLEQVLTSIPPFFSCNKHRFHFTPRTFVPMAGATLSSPPISPSLPSSTKEVVGTMGMEAARKKGGGAGVGTAKGKGSGGSGVGVGVGTGVKEGGCGSVDDSRRKCGGL